jgi:hypothetical protein
LLRRSRFAGQATLQKTCQEETMSIIDKALEANRNYAKNYDSKLASFI